MAATPPRTPEILPSEITVTETLGVGSFGKVLKGKCRGKDVAIKMLHKPILDEEQLASFKKEVAIMSTIFHPNICLFMGASTVPGNFFIVQEFLPGGDVEKLLRNPKVTLSLYRRMQIAKDAALGMNWLHCSRPVFIHRDLKTSNLLLDENGRVKVCDFGLSRFIESTLAGTMTACGTPSWTAPEVLRNERYSFKVDVYSFGIVVWELFSRQDPYPGMPPFQIVFAVGSQFARPLVNSQWPQPWVKLMTSCWAENPDHRPVFEEILHWLQRDEV